MKKYSANLMMINYIIKFMRAVSMSSVYHCITKAQHSPDLWQVLNNKY